jgi:hypothetical protein
MLVKDPAVRPSMAQIVEKSSKMAAEILMASSPTAEDWTETALEVTTGALAPKFALKPTGPLSVDTRFLFDAPELRRLLNRLLPTEDALEAFINVHFPKLKRHAATSMDHSNRVNLLLELVDLAVLSERLRQVYPWAFAYLLLAAQGADSGRQYALPDKGQLVIGRAPEADIQFGKADLTVSRRHANLVISSGEIIVQRLGKNPVYVNGEEILSSTELQPDDRLQIGGTVFWLQAGTTEETIRLK